MKKILLTLAALVLCSSTVFAEDKIPQVAPSSEQEVTPATGSGFNAVEPATPAADNSGTVAAATVDNSECCYHVSRHRCFLGFKHYRHHRYVKPVSVSSDCGCK